LKIRIVTYKATDDEALRDIGDFSGTEVTVSSVVAVGSDVARTLIQTALAELESGKADQIEITRVLEA
jgi:t-SNARE complex subunit (syntaxin)